MYSVKQFPATPALMATVLIVSACGGGGGGDSTTVPTAGVSITTSNAKPVSAAALNTVSTVESANLGTGVLTGVSVQTAGSDFNYPDLIVQQLKQVLSQNSLLGTVATGVDISETYSCAQSGSYRVTGSLSNPGTITVGDTLTVAFTSCSDGEVVLGGSMSYTITQVSAEFDGYPPYTLGVDVDYHNFSVRVGGTTTTTSGDISLLLEEDSSGNTNLQHFGNSLTNTLEGHTHKLTNYAYDFQYDSSGTYSISLQGTLASTKINGSVSYTTITPFTGNDFGVTVNPTAGELHITTSADDSQAWIIALSDGVNVQIDIDTDGDNLVDDTVITTWTELENL
jgi:hypothetical protein